MRFSVKNDVKRRLVYRQPCINTFGISLSVVVVIKLSNTVLLSITSNLYNRDCHVILSLILTDKQNG